MYSTSIFTCIMTMMSTFMIFSSLAYLYSICFYKYNRFLHFDMIPVVLLLITSFFLFKINYLLFIFLLRIHETFWCSLYTRIHHAYFLCFQIIKLQKLKNLMECVHLLLLQMNFQDYFYIHQPFLFKIFINNKWCSIGFQVLIKL